VITDHGKRDQAPIRTARTPAEKAKEKVEENIIFAELDRLAPPDALLVSSTSALVASRFTETLPGRARCLVGHPVNPPHPAGRTLRRAVDLAASADAGADRRADAAAQRAPRRAGRAQIFPLPRAL
jgi:3-hydroxyacyl-CoA dehydrogenase